MPYFNPKPLVFNPDSKVIEASGAIGQSLFEIMKENTKREQENARLAEAKRANLQSEAMKEKQFDFDNTKFDYAKQKDERDFAWDRQKWQTQFNAEQAHRKNQQSLGWANYNLRANELAKQEALRQAELQRQQEAENLQNMAYFDYGVKNGAFGDIANSQEFANLTPQQKASYGANLKAQMNAQGQIYKANEPLFKMQEQERAKGEALRQEQARNLQIAQMAHENPSDFGLSSDDIAEFNQIIKSGNKEAIEKAGAVLNQRLKAQSEINKIIPQQTDPLKNLPQRTQDKLGDTRAVLEMLSDYANDFKGNEAQQSGIIDGFTGGIADAINLASDKNKNLNTLANQIAEKDRTMAKGGARYVGENTEDLINPNRVLANTTYSGIASVAKKHLQTYNEQIAVLQAQGNYKGAEILQNEANEFLQSLPNEVLDFMKTEQKRQSETSEQIKNRFRQKTRIKGDYDEADELGYIY